MCCISLSDLTTETLVHGAFQGIGKPQNGFGDPDLGSNAKQCVIKFLNEWNSSGAQQKDAEQGKLVLAGQRRALWGRRCVERAGSEWW